MAVSTLVYDKALETILTSGVGAATLQVMLLDQAKGYIPDESHGFVSVLAAMELATTNYARQALANVTTVLDATNHRAGFTADTVVFSALGATTGGPVIGSAVIFQQGADDASSPLIACLDGINGQTNGFDVWVTFDSTGIVRVTDA